MRRLKRIGFFLYSCLLLAAGYYGHLKYLEFFYPGNAVVQEESSIHPVERDAAPAAVRPWKTTCDTRFEICVQNLGSGETETRTEPIPEKYVGMDREQFVHCIQDEVNAPSLKERRAGLLSLEVLSFSPERIVLKKSYRREPENVGFYLKLMENRVVVYEGDQTSVYLQTNIDGRTLPADLRREILDGKPLTSREELENFLVSFGSS